MQFPCECRILLSHKNDLNLTNMETFTNVRWRLQAQRNAPLKRETITKRGRLLYAHVKGSFWIILDKVAWETEILLRLIWNLVIWTQLLMTPKAMDGSHWKIKALVRWKPVRSNWIGNYTFIQKTENSKRATKTFQAFIIKIASIAEKNSHRHFFPTLKK